MAKRLTNKQKRHNDLMRMAQRDVPIGMGVVRRSGYLLGARAMDKKWRGRVARLLVRIDAHLSLCAEDHQTAKEIREAVQLFKKSTAF